MKDERHRKHLQELEKQIDSNKEKRNLDFKMKKEKIEGFWTGNEASTQSALAGTKMSQSVKQLRAEQQAKFREGLDSQIEEQKLYRLGGNMT